MASRCVQQRFSQDMGGTLPLVKQAQTPGKKKKTKSKKSTARHASPQGTSPSKERCGKKQPWGNCTTFVNQKRAGEAKLVKNISTVTIAVAGAQQEHGQGFNRHQRNAALKDIIRAVASTRKIEKGRKKSEHGK